MLILRFKRNTQIHAVGKMHFLNVKRKVVRILTVVPESIKAMKRINLIFNLAILVVIRCPTCRV
jgi:hypothetical protein